MASKSVNRVTLLGSLGKDAETRFTTSGQAVTSFSVATSRRWKDQNSGEWKEETDWHNVVLWRAEKLATYLTKGTQVYVEGRLRTRNYDDKDGNKRYVTEVIADEVILCGARGERENREENVRNREQPVAGPAAKATTEPLDNGITDDDVPF